MKTILPLLGLGLGAALTSTVRAADITPAETREHLHSMNRDEAVEALLKMFVGASGPYRYFQSMATPTRCSIDASDRAKTALEVNETVH